MARQAVWGPNKKLLMTVSFAMLSCQSAHITYKYLDPSFGPDQTGVVIFTDQTLTSFTHVSLQSADNKIVVSGSTSNSASQTVVARYETTGELDTTFGTGGFTNVLTGNASSSFANVINSTGNIIVVGSSQSTESDITLWSFTSAGALDPSFGSSGTTITPLNDGAAAYDVGLQSDQTIVIAGATIISGIPYAFIARYTTAGVLDTTYATGGIFQTSIFNYAIARTIAIQPDDKAVVGGTALSGSNLIYGLARLTTTGTLDSTFGSGTGIVTGQIPGSTSDIIYDAQLQSIAPNAGKIIAVGSTFINSVRQVFVARFNTDGSLDTTFASSGYFIQAYGNTSSALAVSIQSNDNIVFTGNSDSYPLTGRLTPNGALDTTFGNNGAVITNLLSPVSLQSTTIDNNDKPVSVGSIQDSGILIRYLSTNQDLIGITYPDNGAVAHICAPLITGTSSASIGTTVNIFIDGILVGSALTESDGVWTFYDTPALSSGAHTVTAQLVNGQSPEPSVTNNFTVMLCSATGATGATGADFTAQDYAYVYHTASDPISTANTFQTINFSNTPILNGWNASPTGVLTNPDSGTYLAQWGIFAQQNNVFNQLVTTRLLLNSASVAGSVGSVYTMPATNQPTNLTGRCLITYIANQQLMLQWTASAAGVSLAPAGPSGEIPASAQLVIERIN